MVEKIFTIPRALDKSIGDDEELRQTIVRRLMGLESAHMALTQIEAPAGMLDRLKTQITSDVVDARSHTLAWRFAEALDDAVLHAHNAANDLAHYLESSTPASDPKAKLAMREVQKELNAVRDNLWKVRMTSRPKRK